MDWQSTIALFVSTLALGYTARWLFRDWRKHTTGCAGCGLLKYRKILP